MNQESNKNQQASANAQESDSLEQRMQEQQAVEAEADGKNDGISIDKKLDGPNRPSV
ncbi:hypothetical protein [Paenibacillus senegalensis]|uniref:hypothetical protein n=1 Tax=Paenibacillus senegalensis TaxID=1465766 RepID=UPI0002F166DE|nr:hypothetical protein [Paenibacillus senegalensis]